MFTVTHLDMDDTPVPAAEVLIDLKGATVKILSQVHFVV